MSIRDLYHDHGSESSESLSSNKNVAAYNSDTAPVPTFTLQSGFNFPALGFGTFAKDVNDPGHEGKTYAAVAAALNAGYRHLDCAWYYENEQEVGKALQDFLKKNPDVLRADILITTKVWPHLCGSPEDVIWSLEDSMRNLQVEYVDCFLVHWPFSVERTKDRKVKLDADGKHIIKSNFTTHPELIWPTMEDLQHNKMTRTIGVSNWSIPGLEILLSTCIIPPAINQIEAHPLFPNTELVSFCLTHDILPVAYSPLGSQNTAPGKTGLLRNKVIMDVASKMGVSEAQVLIAWGIQRGCAVVPKSNDAERIKNNAKLVRLSVKNRSRLDRIAAIESETRFVGPRELFGFDAWVIES